MRALAEVIGRTHLHLMSLFGWLPEEFGDVPIQLEAVSQLREILADAGRWVEAASARVSFGSAGLIANAVLNASTEWEVTVRHSSQGRRYPVRYVTDVAFSRVGDSPRRDPMPAPREASRDRAEIEALTAHALRSTGAYWRRPERTVHWDWVKRPDLVISAPMLLASRPRGLRPNLTLPPSILVIGAPLSGAPEVGALLADTLEWAYMNLPIEARQRFGVAPGSPGESAAQAQIARTLLEDPGGAGRLCLWSYDSVEPLLQTVPKPTEKDLPIVIFLRIPDDLIEYAAQRLSQNPDAAMIETMQNRIRRALDKHRSDRCLTLHVPNLPVPTEPTALHDSDLFFDAHVELTFNAAQWLHTRHGAPALNDAPGILGSLWRSANDHGSSTVPF